MKKILKISVMAICLSLIAMAMPVMKATALPTASVSFEVFYNELSPYGQWIDDPVYGFVWAPAAGQDFRPYFSSGYWVMTDCGNMWVSEYPWGWAPFHYGRWTYDDFYGWVWIPDVLWGPAWVSWRSAPGYYGWAPLGPGVSVSLAFTTYYPPLDWWVFIPPAYIHHHNWHQHYQGPRNNVTIIHNTTVINHSYKDSNHTYVYGPRPDEVKNVTNHDVAVYKVRDENRPGRSSVQNDVVNVYRPSVEKTHKDVAPKNVVKAERQIGKPESLNSGNKNVESKQVKITGPDRKVTPVQNEKEPEKDMVPQQKQKEPVEKIVPQQEQQKPLVKPRHGGKSVDPVKKSDLVQRQVKGEKPQPQKEHSQQGTHQQVKPAGSEKAKQNPAPQKKVSHGKKGPGKK
jgi:hypothetical protein